MNCPHPLVFAVVVASLASSTPAIAAEEDDDAPLLGRQRSVLLTGTVRWTSWDVEHEDGTRASSSTFGFSPAATLFAMDGFGLRLAPFISFTETSRDTPDAAEETQTSNERGVELGPAVYLPLTRLVHLVGTAGVGIDTTSLERYEPSVERDVVWETTGARVYAGAGLALPIGRSGEVELVGRWTRQWRTGKWTTPGGRPLTFEEDFDETDLALVLGVGVVL